MQRPWLFMGAAIFAAALAAGVVVHRGGDAHSSRQAPSGLITRSSMGEIKLHEPKATVDRVLGQGDALPSDGAYVRYRYPSSDLEVTYAMSNGTTRVFSMATTSPRYRTAQGWQVRTLMRRVRSAHSIECLDIGGGWFDCKTGSSGRPPLIDFQGRRQVNRIEVQSVNE